jgi:hypothetical protein
MPQRNALGNIDAVLLATLDLNWLGQMSSTFTSQPGALMNASARRNSPKLPTPASTRPSRAAATR